MKEQRQNLVKSVACLLLGVLYIGSFALHAEDLVLPDPPTPPYAKSEVSYIFSSTYGNVTISGFSTKEKVTTAGGKSVVKVESNGLLRMAMSQAKDLSAYTHLHVDVYYVTITGGAYPTIKIQSSDGAGSAMKVDKPLDQWVSYDIPLTDFTGVDLTKVNYFEVRGSSGNEFYADNAYFYNDGQNTAIKSAKEDDCIIVFDNNTNKVSVSSEKDIASIQVYTTQGVLLANLPANGNSIDFEINNAQAGVFAVVANFADGSNAVRKIIK